MSVVSHQKKTRFPTSMGSGNSRKFPHFLFDKSSQPKDLEAHLKMDQQHLWHPYTSMVKPTRVWPVHSADGCSLHLEDGRHLVDGMASWWCAIHGYNVPELNAAATTQLSKMSHAPWAKIDFFRFFQRMQ